MDNQNQRAQKKRQKKFESEETKIELLERNKQYVRNCRERKKNESEKSYLEFLERQKEEKKNSRERKKTNVDQIERRRNFSKAIIFGSIFICSCCARMLYESGVTKITAKFKEKLFDKSPKFYSSCIAEEILVKITFNGGTEKTGHYICHTCKTAMLCGKRPSMAVTNGLQLVKLEDDCHLTELENNLIAQNINFQYIYCLPKSRWAATKKQMISVPVTQDTILNTIQQLPRMPREAGLFPVELKRKLIYEGCHKKELVDPLKIYRVLDLLKSSGHPYYQFYTEFSEYMKRCMEHDRNGYQQIFGNLDEEDIDQEESDERPTESQDSESGGHDTDKEEEEKENNYITKDPVRKQQFDHNKNTCMVNNYPEIFANENGESNKLSFAPAEGNHPTNILKEKDWDIKSWPALHPDGQYGLHQKRKVKLTEQQYFGQRILNRDLRFSSSPGYIFAAAAYIEQKQLSSKANISFMRGKKTSNNGINEFELEDAFTVFK